MKFVPVSPDNLARRLARWIDALPAARPLVGIDGAPEVGATELADAVGRELAALNRPAVRVSTQDWLRAASLRLEYGKQDVESRLHSWVDVGALTREVLDPLAESGSGEHLTKLRDPGTDRAVRQSYALASPNAVLLVDGALLLTHGIAWDAVIRVGTSPGALERRLPEKEHWQLEAHSRYRDEYRPHEVADVVISYDHPATPAVAGPV